MTAQSWTHEEIRIRRAWARRGKYVVRTLRAAVPLALLWWGLWQLLEPLAPLVVGALLWFDAYVPARGGEA